MARFRSMASPRTWLTTGLAAVALSLAAAALARGQNPPPRVPGAPPPVTRALFDSATNRIPFFPLGESSLALHGPARPGVFVSAVGRRSLAMGTEDGRLELWSWPIKWLHDFELSFRVPKYTEPIPGHTIAKSTRSGRWTLSRDSRQTFTSRGWRRSADSSSYGNRMRARFSSPKGSSRLTRFLAHRRSRRHRTC